MGHRTKIEDQTRTCWAHLGALIGLLEPRQNSGAISSLNSYMFFRSWLAAVPRHFGALVIWMAAGGASQILADLDAIHEFLIRHRLPGLREAAAKAEQAQFQALKQKIDGCTMTLGEATRITDKVASGPWGDIERNSLIETVMTRAVAQQNVPHVKHNQCQEFEHIRHYCTRRLLATLQSSHASMSGNLAETADFLHKLGIHKPSEQTLKHVLAFVLFTAEGAAGARHAVMTMVDWKRELKSLVNSQCGDTAKFGLWKYPNSPMEMRSINPDLFRRAYDGEELVETDFDCVTLDMVTARSRVRPGVRVRAQVQKDEKSAKGDAGPAEATPCSRAAVPSAVPKIPWAPLSASPLRTAHAPRLRDLVGCARPAQEGKDTTIVDLVSEDEQPNKRIKQEQRETPPAKANMTVEEMEAEMRASMGSASKKKKKKAGADSNKAATKRPAASTKSVLKRPAAMCLPAGVSAGCSKCRDGGNGCASCLRDVIHQLVGSSGVE